jgi:hypothetical protein
MANNGVTIVAARNPNEKDSDTSVDSGGGGGVVDVPGGGVDAVVLVWAPREMVFLGRKPVVLLLLLGVEVAVVAAGAGAVTAGLWVE